MNTPPKNSIGTTKNTVVLGGIALTLIGALLGFYYSKTTGASYLSGVSPSRTSTSSGGGCWGLWRKCHVNNTGQQCGIKPGGFCDCVSECALEYPPDNPANNAGYEACVGHPIDWGDLNSFDCQRNRPSATSQASNQGS